MKILVTGEEKRAEELRVKLSGISDFEIDYSDGDEDEDFKEYDCIFDLNFDDDPSNLSVYATMRDTPVFVNAIKLSLNEATFVVDEKIKCQLAGTYSISSSSFLTFDVFLIFPSISVCPLKKS